MGTTSTDQVGDVLSVVSACEVSLASALSEGRKGFARAVGRAAMSSEQKIILIESWAAGLAAYAAKKDASSTWRHEEGLCLALACVTGDSRVERALEQAAVSGLALSLSRPSAHVRTAAAHAIDAIIREEEESHRVVKAIVERLRIKEEDEERRAAALTGPLTLLAMLARRLRLVEVPEDLRQYLGDKASTVRQAAALLLQRLVEDRPRFVRDSLRSRENDDWPLTEGILMALDGILSDEATRALLEKMDTERVSFSMPFAKDNVLRHFGDTTSFEVSRAARQLAATLAVADLLSWGLTIIIKTIPGHFFPKVTTTPTKKKRKMMMSLFV